MNPNEAREEAWRTLGIPKGHIPGALVGGFKEVFDAGWDARGRYDEQRIAEMVAAAEALCRAYYNPDSLTPQPHLDALHVALLALGQSEEVKP